MPLLTDNDAGDAGDFLLVSIFTYHSQNCVSHVLAVHSPLSRPAGASPERSKVLMELLAYKQEARG